MKSLRGLFFLFLLFAMFFSGCATQEAANNKTVIGEKCLVVLEKAMEGSPKSKVYNKSSKEVRQAVTDVLRKQGFSDFRKGILQDEIITEKLKVENPNPADISEDVLKVLAAEHIQFVQAGKLVVVSCDVSFCKIVGSAYRTNQDYPKTAGKIRGDFFQRLDAELNMELSENSK